MRSPLTRQAQRIDEAEELRRVGPVITELVRAGVAVSVDTMRAKVAAFLGACVRGGWNLLVAGAFGHGQEFGR